MLNKLLDLFRGKLAAPAVQLEAAPYKVPEPAADTANVIKAAVQDKIAGAKPRSKKPRAPSKKNTQ